MIQEGLPAVLDVIWATNEDLEYWIKEINRINIKTIAFSFMNVDTRLKASNAWRHYLLGYKILISRISKDINYHCRYFFNSKSCRNQKIKRG